MHVHQLGIRHRRSEKLALNVLRLVLAVVFSALGCVLLFGSSPNRVGRKSPVRASKPLEFQGFLLLLEVRIPA